MQPARRAQLCFVLITLCVFAAFGRVIGHAFLYWDDHVTLFQNPDLNPVTLRGVASYWAKEKQDLYIPVTYAVWGALAKVAQTPAGLDARVFHAANVVVHATAACFAFAIFRLLTKSDLAACIGALLFALHPVQVEPVAWASGMKDVLCGALSLLAIWQYLLFASSDDDPTRRGRESLEKDSVLPSPDGRMHYAIATIAYVLATLAKPSAVTVPLIAAALDYLLVRRDARRLVRPLGVWVLLAFPIVMATRAAQPAEYVHDAPLWLRPIVAWDALAWYVRHLVMPAGFAVDYGRAPQRVLPPDAVAIAAWVACAILLIACWLLRRRWPWLAAGVAVLAFAVAPVLGFVRFDFQKYSTVADHYLYVAMLGPALVVAAIAGKINSYRTYLFSENTLHSIEKLSTNLHTDRKINRSGIYFFAVGIVLVACGVGSVRQALHWRDSQSLFAHTLRVNPRSFAARGVLGYLAREQGDNVRASDHYVAALVIYPDDATTNFNLARVLVDLGQFDRAIRHFERALAAKPDDPQFRNNYGVALFLAGRFDEAEAQLRAVLAKHPDFADAATNLAKFRAASRPASRPAP